MNKLHSFQEFAAQNAVKQQQAVQEEQDAKRTESANSFKSLLSEYGVTSPKELTEEQRSEFFEKLRGAEVNESNSLVTEGTRSHVGKIDKRGNIYSVYVHYDGYPEHMVPTLKHYNNKAKVDQLLDLGKQGISFLDKKIGDKQDFNNPEKGTTLFYGRDRGEKGAMDATGKVDKIANYIRDRKSDWAEYVYLFDERDGKWYMADTYEGGDLKLAESLINEDVKKGDIYVNASGDVRLNGRRGMVTAKEGDTLKLTKQRDSKTFKAILTYNSGSWKGDTEDILVDVKELEGWALQESVITERFKGADLKKPAVGYIYNKKETQVQVVTMEDRAMWLRYPSTKDAIDKEFDGMIGVSLVDKFKERFGVEEVEVGGVYDVKESVVNEAIKVSSKRDANKVYKAYTKIFENATALTADKEVYLGAIRQLFFMAMEDANFAREAYEVMKLIKAPSRFKSFNVNVAELGGFPIAVGPGAINAFLESKYNEISSAGDWGGLRIVEGTALYLDTIGETATAQAMIDAFNAAFENVRAGKGRAINEAKAGEITTTVDKFFKWYTGGERNWWNPNNDITTSMSVDGEHAEDSPEGGADHLEALKKAKNQKIVVTTVDMGGAWENGFVLNGSEYYVDSMDEYIGESTLLEAEITSDDEFKEYAYSVLQKAFGEDFDQAKADEVVNGLLGKADGDYGKAAGMLQASLA